MTRSSRRSKNTSLTERKSLVKYWTLKIKDAKSAVNDILTEYDLKPLIPKYVIDDPHTVINIIFHKFHDVADQLTDRHDNRNSLHINDEYDVQDLLHALLTLYFDDIRPEEWTPSYAGSSSRMDFLLKQEKIVTVNRLLAKCHPVGALSFALLDWLVLQPDFIEPSATVKQR